MTSVTTEIERQNAPWWLARLESIAAILLALPFVSGILAIIGGISVLIMASRTKS